MGLFDFLKRAENVHDLEKSKSKKISSKIIRQQLTRFNQEIKDWKNAIDAAEDVHHPTNAEIIRVYNDVIIDSHLSAAIEARMSKTISKGCKIVDEEGEIIDEQNEIIGKQWFKDTLKFALDSKFFGHSLIEFDDRVGDNFTGVKVFPREYVFFEANAVRQTPHSNEPLIPYDKGKFSRWLLPVGVKHDLGILMKAAPLIIFKKTALGSWTEFAELFGSPMRVGKTNVRDEELRDNMYEMLSEMGRNAFAVLNTDDEIDFVRDQKQDAYKVFDQLVERVNSEISKLILGTTMLLDDGSSRSQGEVHERVSNNISRGDALFIENFVNNKFIPWLNQKHGFNITGRFMFDDTEQLSKAEQFAIDIEIVKSGKFKLSAEYFQNRYGIPVEEAEEAANPVDAENALKKKVRFF